MYHWRPALVSLNGMFNAEWSYKKLKKKPEIIIIIDNFHQNIFYLKS